MVEMSAVEIKEGGTDKKKRFYMGGAQRGQLPNTFDLGRALQQLVLFHKS